VLNLLLYDRKEYYFSSPNGGEKLIMLQTSILAHNKDLEIYKKQFGILKKYIGEIYIVDFFINSSIKELTWLSDTELIFTFKFNNQNEFRKYKINLEKYTVTYIKKLQIPDYEFCPIQYPVYE
jgi:hypothetical protein